MTLRSRLFILFLVLSGFIFFLVHLHGFIQLFFDHAGIALEQKNIQAQHLKIGGDKRPLEIPKIIHQVFHNWNDPGNETLPADWEAVRTTCLEKTQDWEHMLWTESASRDFIKKLYPWFLDTYDGYRYPVQRTDAVRYFLIRHYGGIYLDLDNGCLEDLTALLYYPAWTTDGGRGALSNNILGGRPNHPFWELLTNSLISYDYNYFFPYVTISYASGQWFETSVWQKYHKALPKPLGPGHDERLVRIMMDDRPGTEPWIYFTQERGGSWVNWDNQLFLWVGDHLLLIALGVAGLLVLVGWGIKRCYLGNGKKTGGKGRRDGRGWYARLVGEEEVVTKREDDDV